MKEIVNYRIRCQLLALAAEISRGSSCGEAESGRQLGRSFSVDRPRFEGDGADLHRHDEGGEAHAHGEREHRIQIVVDHHIDDVLGLRAWKSAKCDILSRGTCTYTQHEDETTRDQAERGNHF